MRYSKHIFKTLISLLMIGCATPAILKSDNEKLTQKSFSGDKHIEQRVDSGFGYPGSGGVDAV